jgi:DNA-binding transcriptional regulator GbsR (MarR family)
MKKMLRNIRIGQKNLVKKVKKKGEKKKSTYDNNYHTLNNLKKNNNNNNINNNNNNNNINININNNNNNNFYFQSIIQFITKIQNNILRSKI